jgi:hypothetical protein
VNGLLVISVALLDVAENSPDPARYPFMRAEATPM